MARIRYSLKIRWLGVCFMLFGTLFGLIGGGFGLRSVSLSVGTVRTEGRVVAVERQEHPRGGNVQLTQDRRGASYLPVVRYEVDGIAHTCRGVVAVPRDYYRVGNRVGVFYRAKEPATGYLDSAVDRYVFPLAFLGAGAGFVTLGVFLARWKRLPLTDRGT